MYIAPDCSFFQILSYYFVFFPSLPSADIIISTPDGLVYYAYQHDNVTLECEAEHQTNQYWYFVESNQIIQMGTKYYASGTSLVIRDVGPADAVAYGCALYNMAHSDPIRNLAHVDVYGEIAFIPIHLSLHNVPISLNYSSCIFKFLHLHFSFLYF